MSWTGTITIHIDWLAKKGSKQYAWFSQDTWKPEAGTPRPMPTPHLFDLRKNTSTVWSPCHWWTKDQSCADTSTLPSQQPHQHLRCASEDWRSEVGIAGVQKNEKSTDNVDIIYNDDQQPHAHWHPPGTINKEAIFIWYAQLDISWISHIMNVFLFFLPGCLM